MRIPSFYCPNCRRFKKWYQVTNVDAQDFGNCKHCGTECIDTKQYFAKFIELYVDKYEYPKDQIIVKDFIEKYIKDTGIYNGYLIRFHFDNANIELSSCELKSYITHFSGTLQSICVGDDQKLHIFINGRYKR